MRDTMKAVIAMDSFKGSLSSSEAGTAVMEGIKRVYPDAEVWVSPLADGGEGTVETLAAGMGGRLREVTVTGPLCRPVKCTYAILPSGTAVIEMAAAAGLPLVPFSERNPLYTTTRGVGEVILDAVGAGCRKFLIGIGGSATNDGGIGMLQALGFDCQDRAGRPVAPGALGLKELAVIRSERVPSIIKECVFQIACDVDNPLCGERGCSAVFGPQKGADARMIRQMDGWLAAYAALAARSFPGSGSAPSGTVRRGMQRETAAVASHPVPETGETFPGSGAVPSGTVRRGTQREAPAAADPGFPGSGAAGGMGFAFRTFLGAELKPGIGLVTEHTRLEEYIRRADLVVTGEGRLDAQTVMGKAPAGVAALAKKYGKPVIAFAGCLGEDVSVCNAHGIDAYFPILREAVTQEEAMDPHCAAKNLRDSAEQVFRAIRFCR